jgi:steroid delta-isomerase-like uncharacterized protein
MMTVEENKQLARRFINAWNAGAENSIDALAHPDFEVQYTHFGEPVRGIERFKDILRQTHHSFPDLEIEVEDMVAEGDRVVVWWTYTGTHQQEQVFGAEPTGKRVLVPGITIYRIVDSQVIEERGIVDNMSLMSQLYEERRGDRT